MGAKTELKREIYDCQRILIDTNIIIYFLEGLPGQLDWLMPLFDRIEQGAMQAVVSAITEAELLIKPIRDGNHELVRKLEIFLSEFPNLKVVPVTREIARNAGELAAVTGLRLPDSVILATALSEKCDLLCSNDANLTNKAQAWIDYFNPGKNKT